MKQIFLLVLFLVGSGWPLLSQQQKVEIFVSPDGSDSNSGTMDQAFQSLQRAKSEVQKLRNSAKSDIHVILREGRYEIHDLQSPNVVRVAAYTKRRGTKNNHANPVQCTPQSDRK